MSTIKDNQTKKDLLVKILEGKEDLRNEIHYHCEMLLTYTTKMMEASESQSAVEMDWTGDMEWSFEKIKKAVEELKEIEKEEERSLMDSDNSEPIPDGSLDNDKGEENE